MKKKNTTTSENNPLPSLLVENSPRDFIWENFKEVPGLLEVSYFGYSDTKEALPIGEVRHPASFKFNYIEKGKTSWEVNNLHYETKQGDLIIIHPDEFHRPSHNILEPCRMWSFGFRVPYISEKGMEYSWMQQNSEDIHRLHEGLNKLPRVTFMGSNPLDAFRRLGKAVQQPGPHSRLDGRIAVIDLILQLMAASRIESMENNQIHYKIEKLINKLTFQLGERFSVEEMAAETGISVAYFYRLFLKHTGMTPRTYMERIRIQEACRRLTETKASVTLISMDLGFATSQHFARVFHRMTGTTPTLWRQNNINMDTWLGIYGNERFDFIRMRET